MANKQTDPGDFQLFNLATMSGVFPGTRTARYQRIRLQPQGTAPGEILLARVLWYDTPPACVVTLGQPEQPETPRLRLDAPEAATLYARLHDGVAAAGYAMLTCSECRHWRPAAQVNEDQLLVGRCGWRPDNFAVPPALNSLMRQSGLALDCLHFAAQDALDHTAASAAVEDPRATEATTDEEAERELRRAAVVRKEEEAAARTLRGRIRRLLGKAEAPRAAKPWTDELLERSGVGAGTESCFACQGRIANLGALTVASPEDDKQTYSVWRCRRCFTTYLNRWIDRWERLDSLETDETYWRIAPAEAVALLAVIAGVAGGEHPQGRHARQAEQAHFAAFVADRPPLSRQIKLGR